MEGYFLYIANKLESIRLQSGNGKYDILAELKSWDLWRAVLAEGISTMLFVLIGTMSAMDLDQTDQGDKNAKFVRIAFAFGLMIAVCIQMIGHVSGGHMNPAVSIAMLVSGKISPFRAFFYCLAQSVGGVLGSLILKGFTPDRLHSNLGLTEINEELNVWQGLVCEIMFTFILVMSIMGCTDSNRPFFGSPALGIGLTVAVVHLAAIPFTGASMNPARSLSSALVSNVFNDHWVYWVGPVCGGVIASIVYKYIFNPYKRCLSYEEASSKLLGDSDMIVIPRSYYVDNKFYEKSPHTSVYHF